MADEPPIPAEWTLANVNRVSASLKLSLRELVRYDEGAEFGRWILLYWSEQSGSQVLWIDFEIIEGVGCQVEKTEHLLHVGGPGAGPVMFYATEDREIFGKPGEDMTTLDLNKAVPW